MSTSLAPLDLTGAIVGTQVTLDFNQFVKFNPARMQQKAHLGLFNESGCGLQCVMQASNDSQYLPAGGWTTFEIEPNDSNMVATVTYTLPNPPVSQLNAVYYAPGEEIPNSYTLGNSPIGIGGTVNTSSVQTLSNEGNAANMLVIDTGDTVFGQLFTLFTDGHSVWAVDQSGVKHQVIKIQTAGNPLQLGQAGDTSEVLGAFQVDQNASVRATLNASNSLTMGIGVDTNRGLVIFGHSPTQSGNLLALQTSAFANVFTVDPSGNTAVSGLLHALAAMTVDGAFQFNQSGSTTNGTSGSFTAFTQVWGANLKIMLIAFNSYINNVIVDVIFPTTLSRCVFLTSVTASTGLGFQLKNGVTLLNNRVITGLGTGSVAGTDVADTTIWPNSLGILIDATAADRFTVGTSTTPVVGLVAIIGV